MYVVSFFFAHIGHHSKAGAEAMVNLPPDNRELPIIAKTVLFDFYTILHYDTSLM
jgi:hypothetical protein